AAELAGRYVLGPGAIAEVATEAARQARSRGGALDRAALEGAVGSRLSIRLGAFGSLITRKARFEEMVLPDEVVESIQHMIAMVRERSQILERWGYARHLGLSRGVSALFSGEPGTGKTMAASVVASALGLELMRIDLSAVISKWVGETEKNLAKVFDQAQDAHAMLLFDEADSLFAKRTEVKSAQDRYANLEVNYLLQRMETFDGVSVLTTNFEGSIDQALLRRLNFRVRFPPPEPEERLLLWQRLLPPETGLHDGIDFRELADKFVMTGGYIKNAIVRAAVIAARAGRSMLAEDLWAGAHNEYAEMGKVMHAERSR
ncbi:MAG: ATP-binding protein, partial [Deltaproteobacteria bacterium]|nr:ATP-binding protein [Deltaproteobacteria bacterium]